MDPDEVVDNQTRRSTKDVESVGEIVQDGDSTSPSSTILVNSQQFHLRSAGNLHMMRTCKIVTVTCAFVILSRRQTIKRALHADVRPVIRYAQTVAATCNESLLLVILVSRKR